MRAIPTIAAREQDASGSGIREDGGTQVKRILLAGGFLLFLGSCQAPGERSALPPPLPDKVTPQPYGQLLQRARTQVSKANDAFYVDNWADLEEAARGLEQTAQYLM